MTRAVVLALLVASCGADDTVVVEVPDQAAAALRPLQPLVTGGVCHGARRDAGGEVP